MERKEGEPTSSQDGQLTVAVEDTPTAIRAKLQELFFEEADILRRGTEETMMRGELGRQESAAKLELVKLQRAMLESRLREHLDEEEDRRIASAANVAEKLTRSSTRAAWVAAFAAIIGIAISVVTGWLQYQASKTPPAPAPSAVAPR